jgi:hypothetical protein
VFKLNVGIFACSTIGKISHRLRCLLPVIDTAYTQQHVDLLFGPLAIWLQHEDICSIPRYTDEHVGTNTGVHRKILIRIWTLYAILDAVNHPVESSLPYHIGIWIDLHIKCLGKKTICDIYSNNLAPEQSSISTVANDEVSFITQSEIESIWAWHMSSEYLCSNVKCWKRLTTLCEITPKSKKVRTKDRKCVDARSEFDRIPFGPKRRDTRSTILLGLICDCIVHAKKPRYIRDKANMDDGLTRLALRKSALGSYYTATKITPPDIRIQIYTDGFDVKNHKPRSIHGMLCEYIMCETEKNPILWGVLNDNPAIRTYFETVRVIANNQIRTRVSAALVPPVIYTNKPSTAQIIDAMCGELQVGDSTQHITGIRGISKICSLLEVIQAVKSQNGDRRIYAGVLQMLNMSPSDIDHVKTAVTATSEINLAMETMKSKLSVGGRFRLMYYLWLILRMGRVGYTELGVKTDSDASVMICNRCNTLLSSCVKTQPKKQKQHPHVVFDTYNDMMICSHCCMSSFTEIPLGSFLVYGSSMKMLDVSITITTCENCKCPTEYHPTYVVGTASYCHKCYMVCAAAHVIDRCFCGEIIDSAILTKGKLLVTVDGVLKLYLVCKKHVKAVKHMPHGNPLGWYRAMVL